MGPALFRLRACVEAWQVSADIDKAAIEEWGRGFVTVVGNRDNALGEWRPIGVSIQPQGVWALGAPTRVTEWQSATIGDWIIKDDHGHLRVEHAGHFEQLYEPSLSASAVYRRMKGC
jgi:hypothetical protein